MTTTKEFYEEKLSWGDRITSVIDKPHSEIDQYILERNPSLEFDDDGKIHSLRKFMEKQKKFAWILLLMMITTSVLSLLSPLLTMALKLSVTLVVQRDTLSITW